MTTSTPILRTLLLVSDPLDAPILIVDDLHKLEATLGTVAAAAEFVVQIAEVEAVGSLLVRDPTPFTILHYLGHGTAVAATQAGALVFEDRIGAARLLDPMELLLTLNPTGISTFRLALLSACHSERVAQAFVAWGSCRNATGHLYTCRYHSNSCPTAAATSVG
ncbi:MAG: CHAT domain-containing protein [Caldilineaceae bacterium]|nr:CHAT domain-containing protein [Caldilineaceae bacterium]